MAIDRLSEPERLRLLSAFDELVPQIPLRPPDAVDAELRALRESRRGEASAVPRPDVANGHSGR